MLTVGEIAAFATPPGYAAVGALDETPRRTALGSLGLGFAGLAVLYYGAAKLGYVLAFSGSVASLVWLPVGVAVAFLAVFGLRFWPGALIGDLLANNYMALPVAGALGQTVGNLCEVVLAAWLVRRLLRRGSPFGGTGAVVWLLAALAAGTAVSALIGPLSLLAAGAVPAHSLPEVMRTWWLGDFCGALVVVPLVLAWQHVRRIHLASRELAEAAVVVAAVGGLSALAASGGEPLTYLVFPALGWMVYRFGVRGGTLALLVAVSVMIWTTTQTNPFVSGSITHSVTSMQIFVVVAVSSVLFFAALLDERRVLAQRLGASRARAIHAAETERRRIERDLHDGAQQRMLAVAIRLRMAGERQDTAPASSTVFLEADEELQVAIDELRELTHGMHPTVLRQLGLAGAVRTLAGRSAVPVTLLEVPAHPVDAAAEAAAYFVLTEAMANVQKHATAKRIVVSVRYRFPLLSVSVSDNGRGGAHERAGSGLAGLRSRVEALDGEFAVNSTRHGTAVSATIPAFPT